MKDVVFFTPNRGTRSAAEFILVALNTGGPPRFNKIDFKLIDVDESKCAMLYNTKYKVGHESLLSVETVQVAGDKGPQFYFVTVVRVQSLRGSVMSRTMIQVPEEQPRFPTLTDKWHGLARKHLGHMNNQDLWNHLLNVEKISRMPL